MPTVEFEHMATADSFREDYPEHLCPDDDARTKTVTFVSGTPDRVLEEAEAAAISEAAETEGGLSGAADLTRKDRRALDFARDGVNVPKARWVKALAQEYGVDPWQHVDLAEIDHAEDARPMFESARRTGGTNRGGGAQYDDEATERERRDRRSGAEKHVSEGCDHAEGHCRNGDPAACEYLESECGVPPERVDQLLSPPESAPPESPSEGTPEVDPEAADLSGEALGALKRSWGGYNAAVDDLRAAVETIEAALEDANGAARAINGIRAEAGQPPIHFDSLEGANAALLDAVRMASATCHECHADHSEHDHDVTAGDGEDLRAFIREGGAGTPVGISDDHAAPLERAHHPDAALADQEPDGPPTPKGPPPEPEPPDPDPPEESPASPPEGPPDAPPKGGSEDVSPPGTRALSDDELGEAKKALRFAERNVDDLSRSNLRSVRRHLGSSDGGPITMDPDDWDLLSDAIADYAVDGVGTTSTPEALDSLLATAEDAAGDELPEPSGPAFDPERQSQLDVGTSATDDVGERQVTLTGGDPDDPSDVPVPDDWRPLGDGYEAGPYSVVIRGTGSGVSVLLDDGRDTETVASGLPDRQTAGRVATAFVERLEPDAVSLHSDDRAVPEAAAEAKAAVDVSRPDGQAGLTDL